MLGIVRIALSRPYTFIVLALLILIGGPLAYLRTPTDIFPEIRIPVISVVWQYAGQPPDKLAGYMTTVFERSLTTMVNDIEHVESTSVAGFGVTKIYFQPGVNIAVANAQVTASAQSLLKNMPQGTNPPAILNYNAATVPILQLTLSGQGLSEQALNDIGMQSLRPQLVTVPGAGVPLPFGGKTRMIMVDVDPDALKARGLSPQDVSNALAAQHQITPTGTQKIGEFDYSVRVNNTASVLEEFNSIPIKFVNGTNVLMRDIAYVHDGNAVQTNVVHVDGSRSVLMSVLKNGATSTLDIVDGIRARLQQIKPLLPDALEVNLIGDQSIFVRAAIEGVMHEGILAAALTSLMILLFLGSWRSTVIIAISIPLSVLGAIMLLSAFGETLNIMTLGGLSLAVGILVDDATVTIENINWHLEQGKDVETAILDGAQQIVAPAFVALLCICIVFVPMFFLEGTAKFLFVPMAMSVMFAMVCSFILSRTLVPTMAKFLLRPHAPHTDLHGNNESLPASRNPLVRFQRGFEARFERTRAVYQQWLAFALAKRKLFVPAFLGLIACSFLLVPMLGRNFFPTVDTGQMLLHARAPIGTRVEETSRYFAQVQEVIRRVIPPDELAVITDNIGLPISQINNAYNNTGTIGPQDGDIQITLRHGHRPTADYMRELRERLPREFPMMSFSFLPADITSQILNFGSPSPIAVQVRGKLLEDNRDFANELLRKIRRVPGVADARIQQSGRYPTFNVDIDRSRAQQLGITSRDVTNTMVISLAGSSQVTPLWWLNPDNGVAYQVVAQIPQYKLDSLPALESLPLATTGGETQVLGGIGELRRTMTPAVISNRDILPVIDILASPQGRDLGSIANDIQAIIDEAMPSAPKGTTVTLQGQVTTMNQAFSGLLFGLLGAVVLIYLLIVVNFQSWSDPFVIITALPAALAGIVWMLFTTGTPLSVPALTGAIMCMGVSTANSILVISFARERLLVVGDATQAALEAGYTRFRPVLMTALAMIIGMAPMAIGLGEGGEQNAPLGRAVIGGLIFATIATLFFVPVVFSIVHARYGRAAASTPSSNLASGHPHVAHSQAYD
ncbi:efflux RND transporter permease subunit [Hydrocarboniphaga sp.]|uniref:efflux RND transporter permease subunit n=1 Tax=Hydrocarboniphaga sp. TaxID=2033016 RepID=UPI002ABCF36D|nr:efflux RND transporter permease subunit [Hydrocarboniphaga sp.]MDZ4076802.1 efflux RND transporter permease subunit [Hydrocarboniphaga sp.]